MKTTGLGYVILSVLVWIEEITRLKLNLKQKLKHMALWNKINN
jgi:hypothetical protein